jgi:hypothetical protein
MAAVEPARVASDGLRLAVRSSGGGIDGLAGATRIVTLTNLHPDESYERLYAANFQQRTDPDLLRVTLVMVFTDKMRFG